MTRIIELRIRKILDSRGNPTVEVDVFTESGHGRAAAPSGASTGAHEVAAWPKQGIDAAIERATGTVFPKLTGLDATDQKELDSRLARLDGTPDFSHIGGNVATATSLAFARAAADALGVPLYLYIGGALIDRLPRPMGNVLGGGAHAVGGTDIQEFMAIALGPGIADSVHANAFVHKRVKETLRSKLPGEPLGKGDEGAWVAKVGNEEALAVVAAACDDAKAQFGFPVRPCVDVAATELYRDGRYKYRETTRSRERQIDFMEKLVRDFDLYAIEDPLAEEDFEGFAELTRRVGKKCLVVGDDIFVTDPGRIEKGIGMGAANAVLIKVNQVGTLTRTVEAVRLAHSHGYKTVISHRSGETTDDAIAHIGAGLGCVAIKTGAVGGERIAKLNELIRIEEEIGAPPGQSKMSRH